MRAEEFKVGISFSYEGIVIQEDKGVVQKVIHVQNGKVRTDKGKYIDADSYYALACELKK